MIVGQVFNLPVSVPRESRRGRLKTCPTKQQQPGGQEAVGLWVEELSRRKLLRGGFQDGERADAEDLLLDRFLLTLTLGLGILGAELLQLFATLTSPSQFSLTLTSSHDSL